MLNRYELAVAFLSCPILSCAELAELNCAALCFTFWGCLPLQVINKTDLAEAIGADLEVMRSDGMRMREGGPMVFAQVRGPPLQSQSGLMALATGRGSSSP